MPIRRNRKMIIIAVSLAVVAAVAGVIVLWANGFFGGNDRPLPPVETTQHTEQISTAPAGEWYKVSTGSSDLRIRSGPSTDDGIVGSIPNGAVVRISQIEQGWGRVTFQGVSGWSSMEYLQPSDEAGEERYVSDNGLVWKVAPTLAYEQIDRCSCGIFYVSGTGQQLDPKTGKSLGERDEGHGGPPPMWVYDPAQGLLGHPGKGEGYHSLLGMYPIRSFEESVAQEFEHFPDWFVEESNKRRVVEMVNANLRDIHEDLDGEPAWYLTQEAYLGRFAIMENRKLTSDWFDNITRGTPALAAGGALDTNADLYAARQGGAWQFIDHSGQALIPFKFEHLLIIDEGTAFAKVGGKYGILSIERTRQQFSDF